MRLTGEERRDFLLTFDAAEFARQRLGFEPDEKQAELLTRSPRRCLLNCTRQWGKSTVTAARAVHEAYYQPGSLTLVISPSGRQSGEFLARAAEFVRALGMKVRGDGRNEISLQFPNGSRIVGLPGNEATVRGFSKVSLMLVDEAAQVSDTLYRTVRPMLAVGGGALWLMSTPFGKRGFFYEEWVGDGKWERVTVRATECPRIPAEFLEEERRGLTPFWFRQEYLCEFLDSEEAAIRREWIEAALNPKIEPLRFGWG